MLSHTLLNQIGDFHLAPEPWDGLVQAWACSWPTEAFCDWSGKFCHSSTSLLFFHPVQGLLFLEQWWDMWQHVKIIFEEVMDILPFSKPPSLFLITLWLKPVLSAILLLSTHRIRVWHSSVSHCFLFQGPAPRSQASHAGWPQLPSWIQLS